MENQEDHSDWWWIDYLENEMSANLEEDLRSLLHHSEEDRDRFERFRVLREWLLASDPIASWPLEDRLARVRQNVMLTVAEEPAPNKKRRYDAAGGKVLTKDLSV